VSPFRANVSVNHFHSFGSKHQESFIKWEGTRGAIKTKLGVLLDYPTGQPDEFEYVETRRARRVSGYGWIWAGRGSRMPSPGALPA